VRADQFFYQIRKEQTEIITLEELIEKKRYSLLPGAIRYDKDKVQSSPDDTLSRIMAEITVMETKAARLLEDLVNRSGKAFDLISELTDSQERQVMILYYLTCKGGRPLSWDEVAGEMGYDPSHVKRIRNSAIANIETIVGQNPNNGKMSRNETK